jgi:hypothetical protein
MFNDVSIFICSVNLAQALLCSHGLVAFGYQDISPTSSMIEFGEIK